MNAFCGWSVVMKKKVFSIAQNAKSMPGGSSSSKVLTDIYWNCSLQNYHCLGDYNLKCWSFRKAKNITFACNRVFFLYNFSINWSWSKKKQLFGSLHAMRPMQNVSREKVEQTNLARLRVVSLVAQLDYSFHHPDNKEILYSNVLVWGWDGVMQAMYSFCFYVSCFSCYCIGWSNFLKRFLQICEEIAPYMHLWNISWLLKRMKTYFFLCAK